MPVLSIRNKKSELTKPEVNYLKQHPAYAAQRLQDIAALPDSVVHSILQVNEKFDGSGYPRGFKQDKISKYAQLVAITTRYNEMCNANLPPHRYSPHLAIGLLFKVANKHYNKAYLEQFIKMIGIYPVGTIVKSVCLHGSKSWSDFRTYSNPHTLCFMPSDTNQYAGCRRFGYPGLSVV